VSRSFVLLIAQNLRRHMQADLGSNSKDQGKCVAVTKLGKFTELVMPPPWM